jgi:hypothetical protein
MVAESQILMRRKTPQILMLWQTAHHPVNLIK